MKELFQKLSGPKKLALLALILGIAAVALGNPYDKVNAKVNVKELAIEADRGADKVEAANLADWIIQGKADYRLIDLRDKDQYKEYFIPTAFNIPIAKLPEANLMRNEKIVLYGKDNGKSTQGWFLLKSEGYNSVYVLDGGLDKWKESILFPELPADATPAQKADFDKIVQVSKFFGGSPQTDGETSAKKKIAMPKLKLPAQVPMNTAPRKPKREGC